MKRILFGLYFGLTVFVVNAQGIKHTVKQGETLYGIAKIYNVKADMITRANPELTNGNTNIKPGQVLVIPTCSTASATSGTAPVAKPATKARVHTVAKGETLYAICSKYGVSVADVKQWNNLTNNSLTIGQKLIVAKENKQAIYKPISVPSTPDTPYQQEDTRTRMPLEQPVLPTSEATGKEVDERPNVFETPKPVVSEGLKTTSANAGEYPAIFGGYSTLGYKINRNRGAANYLTDNTSGNQFLAFYNQAETGSIIRVTNMMNKKTIYVKVVGKVPPADASQEVVLKLTNTAATELGAMDDKFLVEVASYNSK